MITLLFHIHFHVFFFTIVLSFNIFTNTSLGTRYAGSGSMEFNRKSLQSNTLTPTFATTPRQSMPVPSRQTLGYWRTLPLSATQNTSSFIRKLSRSPQIRPQDVGPMEDCLDALGDAVQDLKDSIVEMAHIKDDKNFLFLMSNIQTQFSAALANEDSCTDGFSEKAIVSKVKKAVARKIKSIVQLTSNALALINNYASDHVQGRTVL